MSCICELFLVGLLTFLIRTIFFLPREKLKLMARHKTPSSNSHNSRFTVQFSLPRRRFSNRFAPQTTRFPHTTITNTWGFFFVRPSTVTITWHFARARHSVLRPHCQVTVLSPLPFPSPPLLLPFLVLTFRPLSSLYLPFRFPFAFPFHLPFSPSLHDPIHPRVRR